MRDTVWVDVYIVTETDMAVMVSQDPDDEPIKNGQWIPKSQILDSSDDMNIGSDVEIEVPEWLALEKDLI